MPGGRDIGGGAAARNPLCRQCRRHCALRPPLDLLPMRRLSLLLSLPIVAALAPSPRPSRSWRRARRRRLTRACRSPPRAPAARSTRRWRPADRAGGGSACRGSRFRSAPAEASRLAAAAGPAASESWIAAEQALSRLIAPAWRDHARAAATSTRSRVGRLDALADLARRPQAITAAAAEVGAIDRRQSEAIERLETRLAR